MFYLKLTADTLIFFICISFFFFATTRDGFGPNFCGPRPIWADLLWAGPRLGPFSKLDFWAWTGPGLSCFGLGRALGQIENQCWAKFGPFSNQIYATISQSSLFILNECTYIIITLIRSIIEIITIEIIQF